MLVGEYVNKDPLHIALGVNELDNVGIGFTVTVIVVDEPTQLPVVDVGVTTYSTEPDAELLGFVKVCEIVAPELALAPVMEPVFVPRVQAYELVAEDDKEMFGFPTLHTDAVVAVVTDGIGFTVTVIVVGEPTQLPVVEVGVTTYSTDPDAELLGLVNVCDIVAPELALAPVIEPVFVPSVHA